MVQYYNNILCIEAGWMIENGVFTKSNYDLLSFRNHIHVVRRATTNTPALVSWESMPARFKEVVRELLGADPYELVEYNVLEPLIRHNTDASLFFEHYRLPDNRHLPKETRLEYYTNAIIFDAIRRYISDRKSRNRPMAGVWEVMSRSVNSLDGQKYPHSLQLKARTLQRRFRQYRKEGLESLIHQNFLKEVGNAAKIDNDVKESLVVELLADPRNLDNEQVAMLYNTMAEEMDWQTITGGTVANYRKKYNFEILAGRRGKSALYDKALMQVKRSAPTRPLYYWTLDGWDVELLYQKATENPKTKARTIQYWHRPTVVVVLDPCCKYPIGFAVGTHETPELIKAALRNAAKHTEELFGKMYRVHQLQSDNYAIKKMTPLYEAMAAKVTPARVGNAKAKVIEPYFRHLNKNYCQLQPNWSGFGVTSRKENQPNEEFLNRFKKQFPDFEGACSMVALIIERERTAKREEYMELWGELESGDKLELSMESYLYHFGENTGRTCLLQPDGLRVTIKGIKRTYDSFDLNFRRHSTVRWSVYYDPTDSSKILVMNSDESLRFVLEEKHNQPMALREQRTGDAKQLERVNDFNRQAMADLQESQSERRELIQGFFSREQIEDPTLGKLLITDSRGQHKNNRNSARAMRELEILDVEFEDIPTQKMTAKEEQKEKPLCIHDLM